MEHFGTLVFAFVSAFIALFPVVNPIGDGFIVNNYLQGLSSEQRKIAVRRITLNSTMVALGTLLVGHFILQLFGLAVPIVQMAGGLIISKSGWDMLSAEPKAAADVPTNNPEETFKELSSKLFYPISFPMCVGAGTMSVIFTLVANAYVEHDLEQTLIKYGMLALAILAMCALLYICLIQTSTLSQKLGDKGDLIVNKLMAFFTFCIGIQITVTGISKTFHLAIL